MLRRTASVNEVEVDSLAIASVFQIGDSNLIQGYSRAIAVQREVELFFGNEARFGNYSIFYEPFSLPPISEQVNMTRENINPFIKVGKIDIIGISSSSIVQLGNTHHVSLETRIKHIRHLQSKE